MSYKGKEEGKSGHIEKSGNQSLIDATPTAGSEYTADGRL